MNERAYTAGRTARWAGRERVVHDGRLNPASRRDWYAGWDDQDAYMREEMDRDIEGRNKRIDRLKRSVRSALEGGGVAQ